MVLTLTIELLENNTGSWKTCRFLFDQDDDFFGENGKKYIGDDRLF